MNLSICFVIPNFNGARHLSYSLRSLASCADARTATVMVDDASTDDSVQYVESTYPDIVILRQTRNGGFAATVNRGIRWAVKNRIPYVAIFNSDIQVPPGFWQPVIEHLDRNQGVAVAGFQEVNAGSVEVPDVVEFSPAGGALPGMLFICRATALAEQGFFDESYVMYGEECDLFDRLSNSGWQIVQSNIPVWHFVSGSREKAKWRIAWYSYRNIIRHAVKNRSIMGIVCSISVSWYYAATMPERPASQTWLGRHLLGTQPASGSYEVFRARARRFNLGNRMLNLVVWAAAVLWNAIVLPITIGARLRRQ